MPLPSGASPGTSPGTSSINNPPHATPLLYFLLLFLGACSQQVISVWHDIPLYVRDEAEKATGNLNFVCEIPRCSRKKFEIATGEVGNPIKQDTKKGLLREFKKV